jgi:hypothetical protein
MKIAGLCLLADKQTCIGGNNFPKNGFVRAGTINSDSGLSGPAALYYDK